MKLVNHLKVKWAPVLIECSNAHSNTNLKSVLKEISGKISVFSQSHFVSMSFSKVQHIHCLAFKNASSMKNTKINSIIPTKFPTQQNEWCGIFEKSYT